MTETVIVDGYNVIHAIPHLKSCLNESLEMAREELINELLRYSDFTGNEIVVVFDSSRHRPSSEDRHSTSGFKVVFTSQRQTADAYIERAVYSKRKKDQRWRVISGDRKIQDIALGKDVFVTSPETFYLENHLSL